MDKKKDDIIELYNVGCAMLVFSFDTTDLTTKDIILRNFLAKSISQLRTIQLLNNSGQLLDCYIIYRSMVDRLGHLYYLQRTNSFGDFEAWSFLRQIDANNNSLSDVNFKDTFPKEFFLPTQDDKVRYKQIQKKETKWKRPDIEEEFKTKGFYFLYKFGYDYASTHVHPMANDGLVEYYRMIHNPPIEVEKYLNHQTQLITRKSTLISSLTVNECLNSSSLEWRALVFSFLESFRQAINDQDNEFEFNFFKMKKFIDDNEPLAK
ncbi:DUF5677 domain-containing protein [Roseivirga echinicomitans]|uniref:Uncharacterized protein n=1 Tax=Roseivirga echinicomitans TaxID=296218 RepID=A0A150XCM9_9BACT|nr:DUF5677 domain-containing protein [Roseivirga echinicomitans]KYG76475.1 hypothetical protein AWN68_05420 [Roseivirga echinicomitans]